MTVLATLQHRIRGHTCYEGCEDLLCLAAREIEALESNRCGHGWRGAVPEDGARIADACPSCGLHSLFIGTGGYLTCGNLSASCREPGVSALVGKLRDRAERAEALVREWDAAHSANDWSCAAGERQEAADAAMRALLAALDARGQS